MPEKNPKTEILNIDSPTNEEEVSQKITGSFDTGNYANAESFDKLQADVHQLEKDLTEAKKEFEKSRFDLITILGLFVGLITFLGLEVQVFKTVNNPLMIIGVTIFFIASILLFILCINMILKRLSTITWKDFNNPLYIILVTLLLVSIAFILFGNKDYSQYQRGWKNYSPSFYEK